ncbi:MAG: DUF308 domain-containing protein [Gammaproteobacteria bacterium]|nr:DUF308 domain-containing protein [Gammaproteobacteria bacterium]
MLSSMQVDKAVFGQNWKKFLLWGIALVILGAFAISASFFTTLMTVVFIGVIIFMAGVVVVIDAVTFWHKSVSGFFFHALMGILYLVVGITLIVNPLEGSVSLTFLLGILYLTLGIFRLVYSLTHRTLQWGWSVFNALISLLLGVLILANWPASSLYIIGLFVGIDLLFSGWVYIMGALAGRALSK